MSDRLELINGDLVADGKGNIGYARLNQNKTTGEHFIGIWIVQGPKRKSWGRAYDFQPLLDHPNGTLRTRCLECGRPFQAQIDRVLTTDTKQYPKQQKCRTCTGYQTPKAQRERDRQVADMAEYARKTRHHAR